MGRAILASAAVSGLVLPVSVGGIIATDGGWIRNFPRTRVPEPGRAGNCRLSVHRHRPADLAFLARMRERLERFRAVPPVRRFAEIRLAEERGARRAGPLRGDDRAPHAGRGRSNTVLEERLASERDTSVLELQRLRTN